LWLFISEKRALNIDITIELHYCTGGYIRYTRLARTTRGGIMGTVSQPEIDVVSSGIKELNGRSCWLAATDDATKSKA
jgi:hypothetical protein